MMIGNDENTSICEKDSYGTFFDDTTSETSLLNDKYVYRPKYCKISYCLFDQSCNVVQNC